MTTEIQAYQAAPTALANIGKEYGGLAQLGFIGFEVADLSMPRVVIVNGMNQVNEWSAKAGQFHNTATNENFDTLEGILLLVGKGQIWSLPYVEANKLRQAGQEVPVYCRSGDGIKPDPDFPSPPSQLCRICPKAKATRDAQGNWVAPECSNSVKMLFLQWDEASADFTAQMLSLSKTGTQPVKGLLNAFGQKRRPSWSAFVKVTTEQESGNGNTWYVPKFDIDFSYQLPEVQAALIQEKLEAFLPLLAKAAPHDDYTDEAAHPPAAAPATSAEPGPITYRGHTIDTTATTVSAPAPTFEVPTTPEDIPSESDIGF